jgi:hypothetical protein
MALLLLLGLLAGQDLRAPGKPVASVGLPTGGLPIEVPRQTPFAVMGDHEGGPCLAFFRWDLDGAPYRDQPRSDMVGTTIAQGFPALPIGPHTIGVISVGTVLPGCDGLMSERSTISIIVR